MKNKKTHSRYNYFREWYRNNQGYYKKYRSEHRDEIYASQRKYRKTLKGKKAIIRYENKPERRKAKTEWMRKKREQEKLK